MNPLVSIVIPVFEREHLIERTLDTIHRQTYRPMEVIIVDNGSSDKTLDKVRAWRQKTDKEITVQILEEKKHGAPFARQKGFHNTHGEYLIFFDSDDEMHPDLISLAINNFHRYPDTDIVCWKCRIHKLDGKVKIPPLNIKHPLEGHLIHSLLRTQGYMTKKTFFSKTEGWSKPLQVWNDLETGFRLLQLNPRIRRINKILVEVNCQHLSLTGKSFSEKKGEWEKSIEEIRRNYISSDGSFQLNTEKILTYREVILSAQYFREGSFKAAKELFDKALQNKKFVDKMLLAFAFHYTRLGGRGAWKLIRCFYL
ncbi:MAG: glycosyltransferase family 2 protein [Muribaculaceae bacterium]|nr:glycosyltransferase family 2 protein [Muribaculaceae bacterium]